MNHKNKVEVKANTPLTWEEFVNLPGGTLLRVFDSADQAAYTCIKVEEVPLNTGEDIMLINLSDGSYYTLSSAESEKDNSNFIFELIGTSILITP